NVKALPVEFSAYRHSARPLNWPRPDARRHQDRRWQEWRQLPIRKPSRPLASRSTPHAVRYPPYSPPYESHFGYLNQIRAPAGTLGPPVRVSSAGYFFFTVIVMVLLWLLRSCGVTVVSPANLAS